MSTKIPVTLEGNLTADPEHGTSQAGTDWARFQVAVNGRRQDPETGEWQDADTVFHRVSVFNAQARNVVASLQKGDSVVVVGEMQFKSYEHEGKQRESRDVVADVVAPSLRFKTVTIDRSPKVSGPAASATGPVATPEATGATVAR